MPPPKRETRSIDLSSGRREWAASSQLGRDIGRAAAGPNAQAVAGPLGIENVRRGYLFVTLGAGSNITVSHSTSGFASLSTPLRGSMHLSGRPLAIYVAATLQAGASGDVKLSALLRGVEVTGLTNGIPGTYRASTAIEGVGGWWIVAAPSPGEAVLELVADAVTADATLHVAAAANNAAVLMAIEI